MLAGYGEWACGYCRQGEGGRFAWLVKDGNETVAFLTCSQAADMSECEGVLYGVTENATGRGIYGDLIAFSQRFFRDRGISRMKVSTQVQNIAVQRAWVRAGFMPTESFATVHINAFLSHSRRPCDTFPLVVSEADTEHYGRLTGDLNPVHFDDAFAHSIGFEARIAHGIVVDGVASRYFGTIYPGPGCIYLDCSYRFLRPVLLSVPHEVRVTFPFIDVRKGLCKALLRVYDPKGQLCVLSYHDLRMPPESAA